MVKHSIVSPGVKYHVLIKRSNTILWRKKKCVLNLKKTYRVVQCHLYNYGGIYLHSKIFLKLYNPRIMSYHPGKITGDFDFLLFAYWFFSKFSKEIRYSFYSTKEITKVVTVSFSKYKILPIRQTPFEEPPCPQDLQNSISGMTHLCH